MALAFVSASAPIGLSTTSFAGAPPKPHSSRPTRAATRRVLLRASAADAPVGVAVIGCGRIGQVHARTISQLNSASLIAVADPFEKFGRKVAQDFSTEWTPNWEHLLSNDDVNGIVIGSPTPFHAEQIIKSAEAGKDIFCEKPISNDLATIDKCLAAVAANGVRLLVGFQRRFDSNFIKVREHVSSGAIGQLRMFHITSRDPAPPPAEYLANSGGIFLDMTSHDWDMARFITGAEIESVYVTATAFEQAAKEANDVDTVITVLKMSDGSFGTIDNSRRCSYGYDQRIEVFGSEGCINSNNRAPDTVVLSNQSGLAAGLPYSFFMDRYAEAYSGAMTAFVHMIKEGTPAPCTGSDGRASIVAAMAAAKSHAEGRAVRLEECDLISNTVL
ncbi:unnamed protein product [Agarophyton chilense]|eukprot:gb/GEZJ01002623.1/.p1 GENE.gb/GEZJ01002623.1/~~gb/GEZJ01002623.1/.p1  ORF type:complete len:388 (-),score=64.30 gb/GEZJ01002623.1/:613-1776(-)